MVMPMIILSLLVMLAAPSLLVALGSETGSAEVVDIAVVDPPNPMKGGKESWQLAND